MSEIQEMSRDIATLPPATRAVIVLDSSRAEVQLRGLVTEASAITAVEDAPGRDLAHRTGMRLKTARTTIQKLGKAAREDAQAFSKAVIDEEKRLIAITAQEEERVLSLRDAFDAKVEAEREAKEAAERARVAGIKHKIELIRQIPVQMAGEPAADIDAELAVLRLFVPGEEFAEFADEAGLAAGNAITALVAVHGRAVAQEAEAARLAEERAEFERQREEFRIQQERAAAEMARLEAQNRERIEAEERRQAEERERLAEGRRALEAAVAPAPVSSDVVELGVITAGTVVTPDLLAQMSASVTGVLMAIGPQPIADIFAEPSAEEEAADAAAMEANTFAPGDLTYDLCQYTAAQFGLMADKCDLCSAYQMGNYLRDVAMEIAAGKHAAAIAAAEPAALAECDTNLSNVSVAAAARARA